ncbi:hypothetical protein [Halopseudomonas pelagia]|uniref:hypothetical protein n=1 Tax=Halopseudomonas pelagia TaxID=553151 RepID=UPI0003B482EA|nr:hypothetical protein [Halopseudomonas pelagia]
MINYWIISVQLNEGKDSLFVQQERDELFLSANVRLAGLNKVAHIESEEMAEAFLAGCTPKLNKRYGNGYTAQVVECRGSDTRQLRDQIYRDSVIIRARLETGNFVSNRKVSDTSY